MHKKMLKLMVMLAVPAVLLFIPSIGIPMHGYEDMEKALQQEAGYNADFKGYVGSKECKKCHEAKYAGWQKSQHNKMEQTPIWEGPVKMSLETLPPKTLCLHSSLRMWICL
ncbi:MAG: hypothetical protein HZB54_09275 [Deltaproteobacteria bacterium]|nr:hypothetical protein [Deltaproteobacteria bacterium]